MEHVSLPFRERERERERVHVFAVVIYLWYVYVENVFVYILWYLPAC